LIDRATIKYVQKWLVFCSRTFYSNDSDGVWREKQFWFYSNEIFLNFIEFLFYFILNFFILFYFWIWPDFLNRISSSSFKIQLTFIFLCRILDFNFFKFLILFQFFNLCFNLKKNFFSFSLLFLLVDQPPPILPFPRFLSVLWTLPPLPCGSTSPKTQTLTSTAAFTPVSWSNHLLPCFFFPFLEWQVCLFVQMWQIIE